MTVAGVDALARSAAHAADLLGDLAGTNADAGALVIGGATIPRKTGALASTVHAIGDAAGVDIVAGGTVAPYAVPVHARNPFLTQAVAASEDAVADLYADKAAEVVNTITGV